MSKLWQGILAIHDTSGFGHLGERIPGVAFYADRALLAPVDVAVIQSDGFDDYLCWLRTVGIGPKRIVCVDDVNLFRGLLDGPAKVSEFSAGPDGLRLHWNVELEPIKMLQAYARRGGKIQVFCMTEEAEAFFGRAGIDRRHIQSAPLESSRKMNDKAELRRVGERAGVRQAFLPYAATRDPKRVMSEVLRFLAQPPSEAEFVVLKRTNLAGGDGFLKIPRGLPEEDVKARVVEYLRAHHWNDLTLVTHREDGSAPDAERPMDRAAVRDHGKACEAVAAAFAEDPLVSHVSVTRTDIVGGATVRFRRGEAFQQALRNYLDQHGRNEILVEAGFDHWAYSNLVVIRGWNNIRILGPTRQIVDDETGRHLGNMMLCQPDPTAFPKGITGHPMDVLEKEDVVGMSLFSRRLAEEAHTRECGYEDFLGFDYMKRKSDGRIFVFECNARLTASTYPLAIASQLTGRNWGIVMLNGIPTKARTFGELRDRLGDRLFRPVDGGILPFNIRLMTLPDPHCGMIAVAPTLPDALALMEEAKRLAA
jgi:hypothetical protein